jgi:hypothetical protein
MERQGTTPSNILIEIFHERRDWGGRVRFVENELDGHFGMQKSGPSIVELNWSGEESWLPNSDLQLDKLWIAGQS